MAVTKIKANIVAVGKRGKHDLGEANKLLIGSLQKGLKPPCGFSAYWNQDSKLVYTINLVYLPERVFGPKITMYTYPINLEDWGARLKTNHVPVGFLKPDGNPKLICSLEYSLSQIEGNDLIGGIKEINRYVDAFFNLFKANEHEIVPKRELNLLWDNTYKLFMPDAFMEYIKRNKDSFAIMGDIANIE